MLIAIIMILAITVLLVYMLTLVNGKSLWFEHVYTSQSLLHDSSYSRNPSSSPINSFERFTLNFGKFISKLLPSKLVNQLELDCLSLDRPQDYLYKTLAQAGMGFVVGLFCFTVNHGYMFLLIAIVLPLCIIGEIPMSMGHMNKEIEAGIEHVVKCLKVLVVKTETPIITALEIISSGLTEDMHAIKKELIKIINKARKSGIKPALQDWKTNSHKFKDFVAMLSSISEGASKRALETHFNNFLKMMAEAKEEEYKNQAENLQIYLIAPVVLMLVFTSIPLLDVIQFVFDSIGAF